MNWKAKCDLITKNCIRLNNQDFLGWFLDIERAIQVYFDANLIKKGTVYRSFLEDYHFFEIRFYDWYAELYYGGKELKCVISERDYNKKNYIKLNEVVEYYKQKKCGLGNPPPKELLQILNKLNVGEVINFTGNSSYVCFEKNNDRILLKECRFDSDRNTNIFEIFDKSPVFNINLHQFHSFLDFYKLIKEARGQISGRISHLTTAQEIINQHTATLKPGNTRKMEFGPFSLRVKKSNTSNNLKWYDDFGNQLSLENVKIFISWINTTPIVTEFKRKNEDNNAVQDIYDDKLQQYIEQLYIKGNYEDIYNLLETYCKKEKRDLTINMKSYIPSNKGFIAAGFSFCFENNKLNVFKLKYENNDLNKDFSEVTVSSKEEFIKFCDTKKQGYFYFVQDEIKKELEKTNLDKTSQETAAHVIAANEISLGKYTDKLGNFSKDQDYTLLKSYEKEADKIKKMKNNNYYEDR